MNRREFMVVAGGAAALSSLAAARAQTRESLRRIGVLMGYAEDDPSARSFAAAFLEGLQASGWQPGQDVQVEYRWAGGDVSRIRKFAKELVESGPDVILANTTPVTAALHQETSTIPVVFVIVSDPIGSGLITNLSKPGGNITGFINVEGSMGGKWLQLLMEIAPEIKRAALMFNPDTAPGGGGFFQDSFNSAARSEGIEPITTAVRSEVGIEAAILGMAGEPRAGLVVSADSFMVVHRRAIISLANRNRIPAIFFTPAFTKDGGLIAYGADSRDVFHRAGPYVARVLRGEKPGDLPVQVPVKFELVINLKTAKALGLTVSPTLLSRADSVIE
jgi:ABC-type uncharacterized transport system substrate-binding protein